MHDAASCALMHTHIHACIAYAYMNIWAYTYMHMLIYTRMYIYMLRTYCIHIICIIRILCVYIRSIYDLYTCIVYICIMCMYIGRKYKIYMYNLYKRNSPGNYCLPLNSLATNWSSAASVFALYTVSSASRTWCCILIHTYVCFRTYCMCQGREENWIRRGYWLLLFNRLGGAELTLLSLSGVRVN